MKKWVAAAAALIVLAGVGFFSVLKAEDKPVRAPVVVSKESKAEKLVRTLTLEEKVGQLFFVCVSDSSIKEADISQFHLGGYLFFADFFKSRDQKKAAADIASYQQTADIPMLMGVDEEGGTVVRISKFPAYRAQPFSSPQKLFRKGGLDRIRRDAAEKSDLLLSLGINVNLAPVCDMSDDESSFIYPRILGEDAQQTARYAAAVAETMKAKGIGSVLKHFPGYGGNADTHTGIATDKRPYEDFVSHDFIPFQAGIDAGSPCVLVSHNIVCCMDSEKPASLSKRVHEVLRKELHYDRVIMTDDLIMDGVQGYSGEDNIAVAAIKAGNDLLCTSNYEEQIPAVLDAVKNGTIPEQQITESALRILTWKEDLGLLDQQ